MSGADGINSVNNQTVKTKTIKREVNGEKQEIIISFSKDGQKTYSTKEGQQIFVASDGVLKNKTFTTQNPQDQLVHYEAPEEVLGSLPNGTKAKFNISAHNPVYVDGTVIKDEKSGKQLIHCEQKNPNSGTSSSQDYGLNDNNELILLRRAFESPDGTVTTYADGKKTITSPQQKDVQSKTPLMANIQSPGSSEEVVIIGDASKVKKRAPLSPAQVMAANQEKYPEKLSPIEIKQPELLAYEDIMNKLNEESGILPDLRNNATYLDQGKQAYYSLDIIGGSTKFLNTVAPDGNKYLAHKYNDDGVIGLHVLNDEGKVTTAQKLLYPDGRMEDFDV